MKDRKILGKSSINGLSLLHVSIVPDATIKAKDGSKAIYVDLNDSNKVREFVMENQLWVENFVGSLPDMVEFDLSNLAPTALNQSLIPEANGTLDLGSETMAFDSVYVNSIKGSDEAYINMLATMVSVNRLDVENESTFNKAINMLGNTISNIKDPVLTGDGVNLGFLLDKLSLMSTATTRREFCTAITSDALAEGDELSTKLPFSDDDLPSQIMIDSFKANEYLLTEGDTASPKLFKIYDDAGVLKITMVDVEQPKATYMYRCRYDILNTPDQLEGYAEYTVNADMLLVRTGMQFVNEAFAIIISSNFTIPAYSMGMTVAIGDSVEIGFGKVQAQATELFAKEVALSALVQKNITDIAENVEDIADLDERLIAVEAVASDNVWLKDGNILGADTFFGSKDDFAVNFGRGAETYFSLVGTSVNKIIDFASVSLTGVSNLISRTLTVSGDYGLFKVVTGLEGNTKIQIDSTGEDAEGNNAINFEIGAKSVNFIGQDDDSSFGILCGDNGDFFVEASYARILADKMFDQSKEMKTIFLDDSGEISRFTELSTTNASVQSVSLDITNNLSKDEDEETEELFERVGYGEVDILVTSLSAPSKKAWYKKSFHRTYDSGSGKASLEFIQDDLTSEKGVTCVFPVSEGNAVIQTSEDCQVKAFFKFYK